MNDDTERIKALLLIAFVLWTVVTILFTVRFGDTLRRPDGRVPFVYSQTINGIVHWIHVGVFVAFLYIWPTNSTMGRIAIYSIPLAEIAYAIFYSVISMWVITGKHGQKERE